MYQSYVGIFIWAVKLVCIHIWSLFYEDVEESLPINMSLPGRQEVKINMFCDVAHATLLITRRSNTDIIFLLLSTPIIEQNHLFVFSIQGTIGSDPGHAI
jgi:hypothetical protein